MNKKILSIFVMIMALSLFAISCGNDTTNPDDNKDQTPSFTVTLADAGSDSKAFSINAKKDLTTAEECTEAAKVTVSPYTLKAADITATPTAVNLKGTVKTAFTKEEFALDLTTGKLKVGGVTKTSDRSGDDTFTAAVAGTVTFKLTAKGYKDAPLTVYVNLKHQ